MNKDEIKIKITVDGAEEAKHQIAGVQNSCTTSSSAIAKGVFVANLAYDALKATIGAVVDVAKQAAGATVDFVKSSVSAFQEYKKAMTTLEIIAPKFGVSIEGAKNAATELGKELRIGVGPAAESLQNLLKSGLNLEQATDLMKRFTNEAITGKSKELDLATAVQNLSFAYMTQNSMLGNMSGISENFNDIITRGKKALIEEGVAVGDITDEMAKYKGMIELTNLTLGSAEKFQEGLAYKTDMFKISMQQLKIEIGSKFEPVLASIVGWMGKFLDSFVIGFMGSMPSIDAALSTLKESFSVLGETLGVTTDSANGFAETLGTVVANAITSIIYFINRMVRGFTENAPLILAALDSFKKAFGENTIAADGTTKSTFDLATELGKFISITIVRVIDGLTKAKIWWDENKDSIYKVIDAIQTIIGWINGLINFLHALKAISAITISLTLTGPWNKLKEYADSIGKIMGSGIGNIIKIIPKGQFGGIVGGNSTSGDKVPIMVNSGEMILNKEQQGGLFNFLRNLSTAPQRAVTNNFNAPISMGGNRSTEQGMDLFSSYLLRGV